MGRLSELALLEGVTRFMAVLAVFQLLLARYSGQDDVAIGTPVAGRSHPDVEGLIGFFVNTLVMRTDLGGAPSFRELLARVRRVALEAYDHQELPFEKLVEELQPERDGSRNPLVQVVFTLQAEPGVAPRLGDLDLSPAPGGLTRVRFDLELHLHPGDDDSLAGSLHYCTDLFDASTMARFAVHFEALLRNVVANPDAAVVSLPMLADAERTRLVTEWNATSRPLPALTVHRLFEAQARQTPDAIAITWRGEQVTYDALNHRANRLARHLRAGGVGPDVVVAVVLDRSIDLVVTLIAVLKAGGAYFSAGPERRLVANQPHRARLRPSRSGGRRRRPRGVCSRVRPRRAPAHRRRAHRRPAPR